MKNAILPSVIFLSAACGLFYLEYQSQHSREVAQIVSVAAIEKESFESVSSNEPVSALHQGAKEQASLADKETTAKAQEFSWLKGISSPAELYASKPWQVLTQAKQQLARLMLAKEAIINKNPVLALEMLTEVPIKALHNINGGFYLALAYARTGDKAQAITAYQSVLEHDPSHQGAAINLGLLFKEQQDYKQAIGVLEHAVKISRGTKLAKAHAILAACLYQQAHYQRALGHYQTSIEYRPDHPGTWLGLAKTQEKLHLPYQQVFTTFTRTAKLNAKHYKPWAELGRFQLENLDFAGAITSLNKALELSPFNLSAIRSLAWATFEAGQEKKTQQLWRYLAKNEKIKARRKLARHMLVLLFEDNEAGAVVLADLEQALLAKSLKASLRPQYAYAWYLAQLITTDPGQTMPQRELLLGFEEKQQGPEHIDRFRFRQLYHLALQQEKRQEFQQALATLDRLQQSNLYAYPLLNKLSRLHYGLGQLSLANQYAEQALAYTPNDRALLLHKITLDIDRGHFKPAQKRLNKLTLSGDEESEVIALYAKLAWQQRDWQNALTYYRQLLTLELDNEAAHYRLAQIFLEKGQAPKAIEHLTTLLSINSGAVDARLLLAQIHCQQDDLTTCHREAGRVLKLVPTNEQAQNLVNNLI
ncbi:tetratricopeptide repeat protein [Thalassomonas actiniarum]|uniref:Tetratricopeptide repeat protein n=1 Tax=Thalassomonas actiniarum TaxID=485447 RepID=A0AAF0C4Y7_9GAMM|nr:tetratricopeptide repeat protein [Thalassomonas actiniarum]WDE00973.1 tetratricopeptide repeat protein [Thalassomonas actiniarum]